MTHINITRVGTSHNPGAICALIVFLLFNSVWLYKLTTEKEIISSKMNLFVGLIVFSNTFIVVFFENFSVKIALFPQKNTIFARNKN